MDKSMASAGPLTQRAWSAQLNSTQLSSVRFSISLKLYIDCRQLLGCAFNENLFYAICDGVGCQVISVRGCGMRE